MFRGLFLLLVCFPVYAVDPAPEGGHGARRIGFDGGYHETRGPALGVSFRFGLHDLLDRQTAYPGFTRLEILRFRLEHFPRDGRTFVDDITLFAIERVPPVTSRWEELSWKVELGGRSLKDPACDRCGGASALGGLGVTTTPLESVPIDVWLFLEAELLVSPNFNGFPVKPSLGPRLGLRFRLKDWLNGWLYGLYRRQWDSPSNEITEYGTEWRLALDTRWALNLRIHHFAEGWQGLAGIYAYF